MRKESHSVNSKLWEERPLFKKKKRRGFIKTIPFFVSEAVVARASEVTRNLPFSSAVVMFRDLLLSPSLVCCCLRLWTSELMHWPTTFKKWINEWKNKGMYNYVPCARTWHLSTMSYVHSIYRSVVPPEADPDTKDSSTRSLFGRWAQENPK